MNLPDSGRHVTSVNQGLFSTTMEAEKRDPGNEVAATEYQTTDIQGLIGKNCILKLRKNTEIPR